MTIISARWLCCAALVIFGSTNRLFSAEPKTTVWKIDDAATVAGRPAEVLGMPHTVSGADGKSVLFDGRHDALVTREPSPLAGAAHFTIEVLIRPEVGGDDFEQKFFHVEDSGGTRALLELRVHPTGQWSFHAGVKTSLPGGAIAENYLWNGEVRFAAGRWYWLAMTYDGAQLVSYVDGQPYLAGPVKFVPLNNDCRTSIGARLSKVGFFKGQIREVRYTPTALAPEKLQRSP